MTDDGKQTGELWHCVECRSRSEHEEKPGTCPDCGAEQESIVEIRVCSVCEEEWVAVNAHHFQEGESYEADKICMVDRDGDEVIATVHIDDPRLQPAEEVSEA